MTTFLYAISSADQPAPVKIGKTGNVTQRLSQLQTASPFPLRVWWSKETADPDLEAKLHRHFADKRMSGEWFQFDETDWLGQIAEAANGLEDQQAIPRQTRRSARGRQELSSFPFVTHGHRPAGNVPEFSAEDSGTDDRCSCGHPMAMHAGPWPYYCVSMNTGWGCHDDCECRAFRSDVGWSIDVWLALASECARCQAQLQKDPDAELWSVKTERKLSRS
ncbi:GIY-YIG nuclease family protein [Streptomyces sp. NPDC088847]|uniref:GIY-YIG nuclease family protein n=1 Tax=Streptomyces sp. NPDC088847 TaxID=3365909 RepID=UPI0037F6354E